MSELSRRHFLALRDRPPPLPVRTLAGHGRDGAERQIRSRDQGRRRARSQPVAARQARYRHPLGRDRGGRAGDPGRPRLQDHRRLGQAGHAGPDRSALPRLSLWFGDRHSRRRTGAIPGHHHGGVGGRCRRQQSRGACAASSWRRRGRGSTRSSTSPTTDCRLSRSPSSTTSTMRRSKPAQWGWPKIRIS